MMLYPRRKRLRARLLLLLPVCLCFILLTCLTLLQMDTDTPDDSLMSPDDTLMTPDSTSSQSFASFLGGLLLRNFISGWIIYQPNSIPPTARPTVIDILSPDCDGLIRQDPEEISFTKEMLFSQTRTSSNFLNGLQNCSNFRLFYGYRKYATSISESFAPLAYSIFIHSNIEQVEKLIHAIYQPQHSYCLHFNQEALSAEVKRTLQTLAKCFNNVYLVPSNNSRLIGEGKCMEKLLSRDWKYLVLFNSSYFPLKSNAVITKQIVALRERNYIPSEEEKHVRVPGVIYGNRLYISPSHKLEAISTNTSSNTLQAVKINLHKRTTEEFIVTRAFVEYAIQSEIAKTLYHYLQQFGLLASTTYWSTLNSFPQTPGGGTPKTPHIAFAASHQMQMETQINNLPDKPITKSDQFAYLDIEDLSWLAQSQYIFAYNFDINSDHIVIKCIEEIIQLQSTHHKQE